MNGTPTLPPRSRNYRHTNAWLFVAASQLFSVTGLAAQQEEDPSPHSAAELIPEVRSVRPGEPFAVGLRLTFEPGWHSYWLNPGDAGQPAAIDWDIPAGYRAGEILWPFPHKVEESSVVSYGYDDEVILLTEITPPRFLTIGQTVKFTAEAHWLVCDDICLPAMADLEFEVQISEEASAPSPRSQEAFAETRRSIPVVAESWVMSASRSDDGFILEINTAHSPHSSFDGAFFYASERGILAHGAQQTVSQVDGGVRISLLRSPYARGEPAQLRGVLVMPDVVDVGVGRARAVAVDVAVSSESNSR